MRRPVCVAVVRVLTEARRVRVSSRHVASRRRCVRFPERDVVAEFTAVRCCLRITELLASRGRCRAAMAKGAPRANNPRDATVICEMARQKLGVAEFMSRHSTVRSDRPASNCLLPVRKSRVALGNSADRVGKW